MKDAIAIMQPYFMPYIGYFQLIAATKKFVFFDIVQYERHGWMNRNRILNPNGDFTYIIVPINKIPRNTLIKDIEINTSQDWQEKIMRQLDVYKKAPYYEDIIGLLKNEIFSKEFKHLSELNIQSIVKICEYLDVIIDYDISSKQMLDIGDGHSPDEWALKITQAMGFKKYANAIGGKEFFDRSKYEDAKIDISFLETISIEYKQFNKSFMPYLSIIDVLMFNSIDDIGKMLKEYKFI